MQLDHVLQMYHVGYHQGHRPSSIREPPVESATSITVQHRGVGACRVLVVVCRVRAILGATAGLGPRGGLAADASLEGVAADAAGSVSVVTIDAVADEGVGDTSSDASAVATAVAVPVSVGSAARWHATCDPTPPGELLSSDGGASSCGVAGGDVWGRGWSARGNGGVSFGVVFDARLTLAADAAGATKANGDGPAGGDGLLESAGVVDCCPTGIVD